jgi:mono/diheme cytochrome c family protein
MAANATDPHRIKVYAVGLCHQSVGASLSEERTKALTMIKPSKIRYSGEWMVGILLVLIVGAPTPNAAAADVPPPTVDFQRQVRPILSDACFDCHGPDAKARKAHLRLDVADGGVFEDRDNGKIVAAGKPGESELVRRITAADPDEKMPPPKHHRQLKAPEIEALTRWVTEGAKWQDHWSLIVPERPRLPSIINASWPRNGIDTFVLARLEKEGLSPAPEADRNTLIRRVTLDLTGLPPTPAEVDAFLPDSSPDAYLKLVDRLLQSPRYGERMTVDWLDAARYADTNGFQVDRDREMWPWRDWVVDAFNHNVSFDRFTIEQLAGDLLPNPTREQRVATGMHRNSMMNEEGGIIPEEFLVESVADRVETTSTIWLGLTVGCARCHDHKYDPLSQKDYYRLSAFFNNTPETGIGNFGAEFKRSSPPLLVLPTKRQQETLDRLAATITDVEKQLAAGGPTLASEQAAWEKTAALAQPPRWVVLDPTVMRTKGGTSLVKQADLSIRADGPNPPTEIYELAAVMSLPRVSALRVEALPDERLVGNGPGRSINGNIVLTDVRMSAAGHPAKFRAGSADFAQVGFPIASAFDGDPQTGWAIHPEMGKAHAAVFELEKPIDTSGSVPLAISLAFESVHAQHQLGKFRLSVTDAENPLTDPRLPESIARALAIAADKRDDKQKAELHNYYRQHVSATIKRLEDQRTRLRSERAELEKRLPTMMVMSELPKPRETYVLIRGQYDKKGDKVDPGTPVSLPPLPATAPRNRLGLAQWLVDPRNPLTARVTVNRYWQSYFGAGLVRTAEDFGSQGEAASHPELLDWLATEFVQSGWDIKRMQRSIVTSATYRQSSRMTPVSRERDPENRLLDRGPRIRLPVEMIRDQALAVSGLMAAMFGGPPVKPYHPAGLYEQIVYQGGKPYQQGTGADLYRRSLYTYRKRSVPHPAMLTFDAPFRETCIVRRARTSTPLQALNLMNDPTYVESARFLAQRMMIEGGTTPEGRISHGFRLVVARSPRPAELEVLTAGFRRMLDDFRQDRTAVDELLRIGESPSNPTLDRVELAAYATVGSTLLNLDETITKD